MLLSNTLIIGSAHFRKINPCSLSTNHITHQVTVQRINAYKEKEKTLMHQRKAGGKAIHWEMAAELCCMFECPIAALMQCREGAARWASNGTWYPEQRWIFRWRANTRFPLLPYTTFSITPYTQSLYYHYQCKTVILAKHEAKYGPLTLQV